MLHWATILQSTYCCVASLMNVSCDGGKTILLIGAAITNIQEQKIACGAVTDVRVA